MQRQQPSRAVNSFIDQGEFVAIKTSSGRKAPRCDREQFRDKMTVNPFRDIAVEPSCLNKNEKNGTFANRTLMRLPVFRVAFGYLYDAFLTIKALKEKD